MKIRIDDKEMTVIEGETILETARRHGMRVPSMCYAHGRNHVAGCMVCAMKNTANGQMITSCSTMPVDGMCLESETDEVRAKRALALELLLSDHRADCEAPCTLVCPKGLDIELFLQAYDRNDLAQARAILASVFTGLPSTGCEDCKAPCEKVCRRGTVDRNVPIRKLIAEVASMEDLPEVTPVKSIARTGNDVFCSKLGRFTPEEKARIAGEKATASTCLHCACSGRLGCRLRTFATQYGIRRPRYDMSSALPVKTEIHVKDRLWFEPAKCIRCGLCVYNTENGFTFYGRGFDMKVVIPDANRNNVDETVAGLCPTGALHLRK